MAKSKKPKRQSKKKPSLPARTAAKLVVAVKTARTVVRASKATIDNAKKAPGSARKAIEKFKSEAQAAGHMAEVGAERATKVIAITAGVVAGLVEAVSHHEPPAADEPTKKPTRAKAKEIKSIPTTRPSSSKSDKKPDGHR
jgi:hypothetical protein